VKILTVSDRVHPELLKEDEMPHICRGIDLIFSCGDLPPEFLTALRFLFDVPLYYVLGNHDLRYSKSSPQGCKCVDGEIVSYKGLSIVGFSGSRWYNGGLNQYTEKEMSRSISRIRFPLWRNGTPDIVITHAPPRHIGDAEDPCHKGFRCYTKFIEKYRPSYFIHGHIHRQFEDDLERITFVNKTQVINSYGFHILEI
jgi:Icc-related predicted phosphoesterase